jgi:hypothetical protein
LSKQQKLLKHLMRVQNKSGATKPAPHTLLKLKEAIEKVPFELLQKGMSGVVNNQAMMKGITKLAKQLGGLNNVGQFKNIMSQASSSGTVLNEEGAARIASQVRQKDLEEALGGAMALGVSLMAGLSAKDQKEIDDESSNGTALETHN